MSKLFPGEIVDHISDRQISINNSASCEVVFTRRTNDTIGFFFSDSTNPVNQHTIARWRAYIANEWSIARAEQLEHA